MSKKRGRGRPTDTGEDEELTEKIWLRVTPGQKAKYMRLGGSPWGRRAINKAKEPKSD